MVRRRQKRQTVIETSCHHCCHCCKMRSRRLSYQEMRQKAEGEVLVKRTEVEMVR